MTLIDQLLAEQRAAEERDARRRGISVQDLRRDRAARDARFEAEMRARPCYGMTRDEVKAWMIEHARVGLWVVVRDTSWNNHTYALDQITEVKPRAGRFHTRHMHSYKGGAGWYFSGQSTLDPKGRVEVLIPTPALVEVAVNGEHPRPKADDGAAARKQAAELFPDGDFRAG
jgi:hypothetical protein